MHYVSLYLIKEEDSLGCTLNCNLNGIFSNNLWFIVSQNWCLLCFGSKFKTFKKYEHHAITKTKIELIRKQPKNCGICETERKRGNW